MTYRYDIHHTSAVVNRVNHAIFADPNPPKIVLAHQLLAACWPSVCSECLDLSPYSLNEFGIQTLKFFTSRPCEGNRIVSHCA